MRLVFLILLLSNAIYFGWQYYLPAVNYEDNSAASDPGLEKLVLLHEVTQSSDKQVKDKRQAPAPVLPSTPKPVSEPKKKQEPELSQSTEVMSEQMPDSVSEKTFDQVKVIEKSKEVEPSLPEEKLACYEVGPYKSNNEARQALEILDVDVRKIGVIAKPRKISKYWVFLAPQKSLWAARQTIKQLASKGVKDYQIVTIEGKKNGISLGLYREKTIAELRVRNIKRLGYAPKVNEIEKKFSEYWLEVVINQLDKDQQERLNVIPEGMLNQTSCN